jgi:hypothetical protein
MERVCRALEGAGLHLAAQDRADSARQPADRVTYSPLRTLVDHGQQAAERVLAYLRGSHDPPAYTPPAGGQGQAMADAEMQHLPQRPSWVCDTCDDDWPCNPARQRLAGELGLVELILYMTAQLDAAKSEAAASIEELYQRFMPWVYGVTAPGSD